LTLRLLHQKLGRAQIELPKSPEETGHAVQFTPRRMRILDGQLFVSFRWVGGMLAATEAESRQPAESGRLAR